MEELGNGAYRISCVDVNKYEVPERLARKMRASYYFLGALLGRFGKARAAMPGGCNLGERPIDQHLLAFEALGADTTLIKTKDDSDEEFVDAVELSAKHLKGALISLNVVSVGATMNAILAAVKAEGVTIIENCAREPHIVDLANFLNYMGANISGAGTHKIIIEGTPLLQGNLQEGSVEERIYSVVPDQIEAGTFMVAAAATRGDVLIHGVIPYHLKDISERLAECGVQIQEVEQSDNDIAVRVYVDDHQILHATNIKTEPYPGFPYGYATPNGCGSFVWQAVRVMSLNRFGKTASNMLTNSAEWGRTLTPLRMGLLFSVCLSYMVLRSKLAI